MRNTDVRVEGEFLTGERDTPEVTTLDRLSDLFEGALVAAWFTWGVICSIASEVARVRGTARPVEVVDQDNFIEHE